MIAFARIVLFLLADLVGLALFAIRPRRTGEAENLVLRRQLALYKERGVKPRRIDPATRFSLAWLSRWCNWRACLIVVRPETVICWHRAGGDCCDAGPGKVSGRPLASNLDPELELPLLAASRLDATRPQATIW